MYIKRIELRLLREKTVPYSGPINSAANVYEMFSMLSSNVQEEIYAIYLDAKNRVVGYYQVAKGSINHAHIKAADVLRPALLTNATSCILVHNHPSGVATPSEADLLVTKQIAEAGKILGLDLIDHLIVTKDGFQSISLS